jgi:hypothetical protein
LERTTTRGPRGTAGLGRNLAAMTLLEGGITTT